MGCGESKHAVATENTLTKSKSKTSVENISRKDEDVIPPVVNNEEPRPQLGRDKEKGNAEMMRKEISIDVPIQKGKTQGYVVVVEEKKNEDRVEVMLKKEVQLSQQEQERLVLHDSPNSILPPVETVESVAVDGVSDQPESSSPSIPPSQSEDRVEENETNSNEEKDDTTVKIMDKGEEAVPAEADVAKSSVAIGEEKKTSVETEKENAVAEPTVDEKPN